MVLCNSAHPLVIYFLAFWSRAFITECRFEVCKWDFNLVTWYPVTQIFIAKTCGVLTCTRQQDNSGRYNSIIVSVDTLITGSYNAVMSWEHLGHRRPKLSLWGVTFFFQKIFMRTLWNELSWHCYRRHPLLHHDLTRNVTLAFEKVEVLCYNRLNLQRFVWGKTLKGILAEILIFFQ